MSDRARFGRAFAACLLLMALASLPVAATASETAVLDLCGPMQVEPGLAEPWPAGRAVRQGGVVGPTDKGLGCRFTLTGKPAGGQVMVEARLTRPNASGEATVERWFVPARRGEPTVAAYALFPPGRAVSGTWTLELFAGNDRLAGQDFTVQGMSPVPVALAPAEPVASPPPAPARIAPAASDAPPAPAPEQAVPAPSPLPAASAKPDLSAETAPPSAPAIPAETEAAPPPAPGPTAAPAQAKPAASPPGQAASGQVEAVAAPPAVPAKPSLEAKNGPQPAPADRAEAAPPPAPGPTTAPAQAKLAASPPGQAASGQVEIVPVSPLPAPGPAVAPGASVQTRPVVPAPAAPLSARPTAVAPGQAKAGTAAPAIQATAPKAAPQASAPRDIPQPAKPLPAKSPDKETVPPAGPTYALQTGLFAEAANAEGQAARLRARGMPACVSVEGEGSNRRYRVLAGRFGDNRVAARTAGDIKAIVGVTPLVQILDPARLAGLRCH